eukprot:10173649-Alexandrium_andersonii.AAC.1
MQRALKNTYCATQCSSRCPSGCANQAIALEAAPGLPAIMSATSAADSGKCFCQADCWATDA